MTERHIGRSTMVWYSAMTSFLSVLAVLQCDAAARGRFAEVVTHRGVNYRPLQRIQHNTGIQNGQRCGCVRF